MCLGLLLTAVTGCAAEPEPLIAAPDVTASAEATPTPSPTGTPGTSAGTSPTAAPSPASSPSRTRSKPSPTRSKSPSPSPDLVEVPNIVGMAQPYAVDILRDADFRVRVEEGSMVALGSEAGLVEQQRPTAGTARVRGTTVTIVVTVTAGDEPVSTAPPGGGG
ncbi:PASTA domain-containing protein [Micromonospora sp. BQ11]|uniref:PASTA domain-containing protein n=1 Tax=Micromonospora sp. BQ11 TaxID=3452212 RepID=UPI003F8B5935